jgi:membrane-associated phospholipid phosphatase
MGAQSVDSFGVPGVSYLSCFLVVLTHPPLYSVDHHLSSWFHAHLAGPFTTLMLAFTDLACEWSVGGMTLTIAFVLIFRRRWYALLTLLLTVPGGSLLGELIKELVHRDRPYHQSTLIDLSGYSFPSGHTLAATLLYGLLASFALLVLKSLWLRILAAAGAALIITLVGLSRIALGAHFLTDVLGAMAVGLAWLWFCLKLVEVLRGRPSTCRGRQ